MKTKRFPFLFLTALLLTALLTGCGGGPAPQPAAPAADADDR